MHSGYMYNNWLRNLGCKKNIQFVDRCWHSLHQSRLLEGKPWSIALWQTAKAFPATISLTSSGYSPWLEIYKLARRRRDGCWPALRSTWPIRRCSLCRRINTWYRGGVRLSRWNSYIRYIPIDLLYRNAIKPFIFSISHGGLPSGWLASQ